MSSRLADATCRVKSLRRTTGLATLRCVTDTAAAHDLSDPSTDPFAVAEAAAAVIRERTGVERHDVALVLGSGWGQTGDLIGETLATIDNTDVPGFGKAAVAGHSGVMRSVAIGDTGRRALVYGTRTHYYEGRGVRAVVHGIRTAAAAGCRTVVITNGCGGLRAEWAPGTPVLISDHINLTGDLPHRGRATSSTSPTSTRPGCAPSPRRSTRASTRASTCSSAGRTTRPRPRCGWPASSAATWSACRPRSRRSPPAQSGLEVLGISLVTNPAAGISTTPLNHEEVLEAGRDAADRCGRLLAAVVGRI